MIIIGIYNKLFKYSGYDYSGYVLCRTTILTKYCDLPGIGSLNISFYLKISSTLFKVSVNKYLPFCFSSNDFYFIFYLKIILFKYNWTFEICDILFYQLLTNITDFSRTCMKNQTNNSNEEYVLTYLYVIGWISCYHKLLLTTPWWW